VFAVSRWYGSPNSSSIWMVRLYPKLSSGVYPVVHLDNEPMPSLMTMTSRKLHRHSQSWPDVSDQCS
jgi:hypothetical protein